MAAEAEQRVRGESGRRRRPWHLWLVAIVAFALYLGGARDYLLILIGDTDYIRGQFAAAGVEYFADYPPALRVIWTINVLGGLISPVLLVLCSRWAVLVAAAAVAAQVVLMAITFAILDRWSMLGAATSWFDIGIAVITALFTGYCWWLRRRGVLT